MTAFFEKSYKNTRTKISAAPYGAADIFMLEGWDSKDSIQPAGGQVGQFRLDGIASLRFAFGKSETIPISRHPFCQISPKYLHFT